MTVHRRRLAAALLPLFALLVTLIPYQSHTARAWRPAPLAESRPMVALPEAVNASADATPADRALVQASLLHPIQDDSFYFVLPDRFENADSANDAGADAGGSADADVLRHGFLPTDKGYFHGGDIKGLTSRLDYLEGMGITAIWMAPIFKNRPVQGDGTINGSSAGYHGYWITDFTQVDPHFGTNADLQALVSAAHARDIKVFFDIITNHTADVIAYAENQYGYRNKEDFPYKDASGNIFDDAQFAGTNTFPELDVPDSFPYTPVFRTPADASVKTPAWLNNPKYYHNRGDTTFSGENSLYGDFFGLDDLWTEQPAVVDGMIDIYKQWITDFKIDGFRVDTVKHVNIEFWQKFAPAIQAHALAQGIPDFFVFGEVFDGNAPFLSDYTTRGKLSAVLDFGFQGNATGFASQSGATNNLKGFFEADDYYTDADSNAYRLPTFLGNHDLGRLGRALRQDNPGASDAELVARSRLAHSLMYFARGMPVVYSGDEQGFTGDGNDKDAREDMFPSQVASYNDNDLIGTDATTAASNFDTSHPLYEAIAEYAGIRQAHPALSRGAQIQRFSTDTAGVYAFSRIDRDELVEYVVAFNNAEAEQSATFKTYGANGYFSSVYPASGTPLQANVMGEVTVTVPPLSVAIYKADDALAARSEAPGITLTAPADNEPVRDRVEVAATLDSETYAEVTFAVRVGDAADYTLIGTDNNPPYRVFYDTSELAPGTPLSFKAIVNDVTDDSGNEVGDLNVASVGTLVGADPAVGCAAAPEYAIIHYQRQAGDYGTVESGDYWGLHLFGDAIADGEGTDWPAPKPFMGEDDYGRFAFIKLKNASKDVSFIVHKPSGDSVPDTREPGGDRSFKPSETPEIWLKQGDAAIYTSAAAAQGFVTVHYKRSAGDYGPESGDAPYWGLHLWGDAIADGVGTDWSAPRRRDGVDAFGAFYNIPIKDATKPVNFIVHTPSGDSVPDTREPGGDRNFIPDDLADIWLVQGDERVHRSRAAAENMAVIHYHRPDGDYGDATSTNFQDFWGLHVWTGAATPTAWPQPIKPAGRDAFGVFFNVPLQADATTLAYIIHRGDAKDPGPDQFLDLVNTGYEVWQISGRTDYLLPTSKGCVQNGDLSVASAHWVSEDTIAWNIEDGAALSYQLHYQPTGAMFLAPNGIVGGEAINLTFVPGGLSPALKAKFPHLATYAALRVSSEDRSKIRAILKGEIAVSATAPADEGGALVDATSLQIPGVVDALYAYGGELGVMYQGQSPILRLWAPTATSVTLHLFDTSTITESTTYAMTGDAGTGVWSVSGAPGWSGKFYMYEVEVYAPSTGKVERNMVTDPYSFSLSMNSTRSQIVNLADAELRPAGWNAVPKPRLDAFEDIVLYELHLRDFSINDASVTEPNRGTYKAFTERESDGMRHLRGLATAGLTHIHLLPVFDIASINENAAERMEPDAALLATYPPSSTLQQAAVAAVADEDGFNWGYDPYHFTAPEGSYATNPDGTTRIREFREMVASLNESGLRVVMDVVYNHTAASGQSEKSVLDKVVPGYYHRLNPATGAVETSTCCQNTATEHAMMEKLMIDSVVTWATQYKIDGFRFDLMGHHMKVNMVKLRQALNKLTIANSGVNGSKIYLYGEGWNFGEVANNARGVNATQLNMPGTGIGTFNDRLRDAVRGGGPFDSGEDLKKQGFVNGLYYDPNDLNQGTTAEQRARLLLYEDQIRVGLAGNLRDYLFEDRNGATVTGKDVDYNGSPTGYALDPQETINYIEAHDNQTLFDAIQTKAPISATVEARVRMHNMGMSVVSLAQGVPFFQAGQDMLRSKSLDRNSYNSGDWFNKLDFTFASNNWGVGLPPAENEASWPVLGPLLANPALNPAQTDILDAVDHFQEMLRIRTSSKLFRLETAEDILHRVRFHNTGTQQEPGLIVMSIADGPADNEATQPEQYRMDDLDPRYEQIVVLFNATDDAQSFTEADLAGTELRLHPVQANSADSLVRTTNFDQEAGAFTIPPRTTAVFVEGTEEFKVFLPLVRNNGS